MERIGERVEWKFVIIRPGGLSAIMSMVHMLHTFSVYNWASMVSMNTKSTSTNFCNVTTLSCCMVAVKGPVAINFLLLLYQGNN